MAENNSSTRNKKILDIESRLTYLTENEPDNEEIYHLLKKLARTYINQNKFVYGYNGIEDVCHDVAADTWMAVRDGRKIHAWIYYIGKMIKLSYVTKQRSIEHEVIETDGNPELRDEIKRMCAGSAMSFTRDFDIVQRNLMLDGISNMIEEVMKRCKFKRGSKEYFQLHTNVCINLVRLIDGDEKVQFRIDDAVYQYLDIIINAFKKYFRNCGFTESIMDNVDADLEMHLCVDESYIRNGGSKLG